MTTLTLDYRHIESFRDSFLPMYLMNNIETLSDTRLIDANKYNKFINSVWEAFCKDEDINGYSNFTGFVHALRMAMTHETRNKYALVLIKIPYELDIKGEASTSIVLAQDLDRKTVRYFHLEELNAKIVPESFININKKYLLKEYNYQNHKSISWGQLINPRDLSALHDGILKLLI